MRTILFLVFLIGIHRVCLAQAKKILIVSTNIDSVGNNKSGTYLKEIAYPFRYFTEKGFEVDIVTPKGGKAALYHTGAMPEALAMIQNSRLFGDKTENTLQPEQVDYRKYAGIYYPGGHGQYFDVLFDQRIADIASAMNVSGAVLGAAGHGMSSWVNIRTPDCRWLVEGLQMTCFPAWAEKSWMNISGYGRFLPMNMEEQFKRKGAKLIIPASDQVNQAAATNISDEKRRVVTGSFAFNAQWVAEEMVRLITGR